MNNKKNLTKTLTIKFNSENLKLKSTVQIQFLYLYKNNYNGNKNKTITGLFQKLSLKSTLKININIYRIVSHIIIILKFNIILIHRHYSLFKKIIIYPTNFLIEILFQLNYIMIKNIYHK